MKKDNVEKMLRQAARVSLSKEEKSDIKKHLLEFIGETEEEKLPEKTAMTRFLGIRYIPVYAMALVFACAFTVKASETSLPGELLYSLRIAAEKTHLALSIGDYSRALTAKRLAERNLADLKRIIAQDDFGGDKLSIIQESIAINLGVAEEAIQRMIAHEDSGNATLINEELGLLIKTRELLFKEIETKKMQPSEPEFDSVENPIIENQQRSGKKKEEPSYQAMLIEAESAKAGVLGLLERYKKDIGEEGYTRNKEEISSISDLIKEAKSKVEMDSSTEALGSMIVAYKKMIDLATDVKKTPEPKIKEQENKNNDQATEIIKKVEDKENGGEKSGEEENEGADKLDLNDRVVSVALSEGDIAGSGETAAESISVASDVSPASSVDAPADVPNKGQEMKEVKSENAIKEEPARKPEKK